MGPETHNGYVPEHVYREPQFTEDASLAGAAADLSSPPELPAQSREHGMYSGEHHTAFPEDRSIAEAAQDLMAPDHTPSEHMPQHETERIENPDLARAMAMAEAKDQELLSQKIKDAQELGVPAEKIEEMRQRAEAQIAERSQERRVEYEKSMQLVDEMIPKVLESGDERRVLREEEWHKGALNDIEEIFLYRNTVNGDPAEPRAKGLTMRTYSMLQERSGRTRLDYRVDMEYVPGGKPGVEFLKRIYTNT